jgi:hypothetical protein
VVSSRTANAKNNETRGCHGGITRLLARICGMREGPRATDRDQETFLKLHAFRSICAAYLLCFGLRVNMSSA